jgi:hypothetical protein
MSESQTPAGFAPIFQGWNVWCVHQKNDLDFEPMMLGLSPERRLRIWVEEQADAAPGAAVDDPANPTKFKGDLVQLIPSTEGLSAAARKETVPGDLLLLDGPATLHCARFFNRGGAGVIPWPHSANYLLDAVYTPTAESPITSAPAPDTLAGAADQAAKAAKTVLVVVGIVAGVGLAVVLLSKLSSTGRDIAA